MLAVRNCWRPALLAMILATPCAAADNFVWETDLDAARQTAAKTNRLLLVHFGAPWCQPCQQLEREVFSKPGFGRELQPLYVGVKLNYDSFPATARQYGVQSIPTDVIITPQGQLVERVQSPLNGVDYVATLTRCAAVARANPAAPPGAAVAQMAPPPTGASGRYASYYGQQQGAPPPAANPGPTHPQDMVQPAQAAAVTPMAAPPPQIASGNSPLGLDGFCPVALSERQAWVPGDARWGMQHRGRTYLFSGPEEQKRFAENPDRYSPVMSGNDPVLALDQGQSTPGSRMYGVYCGGHVYLFASEQTLQAFQQNPRRYAAEAVQARR